MTRLSCAARSVVNAGTAWPCRLPLFGCATMAAEEAPAAPAGSAPAVPAKAAAVAAAPSPDPSPKSRSKRPRIDLDDSIQQAREAMKAAQKEVAEARRLARNERRKKQRLLKKAVILSADDLERIAVLKRCGLSPSSNLLPSTASSSRDGAAAGGSDGAGVPAEVPAPSAAGVAASVLDGASGSQDSDADREP